jgi:hypothetical protein
MIVSVQHHLYLQAFILLPILSVVLPVTETPFLNKLFIINNYNLNKKAIRMMEAQDASISEEEESDRWRPNQQHNDGSK